MSTTYCEHLSATGITRYDGPEKVWRCDGCGWLYVNATDERGITHQLDIEGALATAMNRERVFDLTADESRVLLIWRKVQRMHVDAGPLAKPSYDELILEGWADDEARGYLDGFEERTEASLAKARIWCSSLDKLLGPIDRLVAAVARPESGDSDPGRSS